MRIREITPSPVPPKLTDQLVGLRNGTIDNLFSLSQVATSLSTPLSVAAFDATGNGVTDDTAAIQAAINAAGAQGGGIVSFPPAAGFLISSTLTNPFSNVFLQGSGQGAPGPNIPVSAATRLLWGGAAGGTMMIFGHNGAPSVTGGGGISWMMFDGQGIAAHCLIIKDAQHAQFVGLSFQGGTSDQIQLTNSTNGGNQSVTGFNSFYDIQVFAWDFLQNTQSADGIFINGVLGIGAEGTTLNEFYNVTLTHFNGHGIRFGQSGDAFKWSKIFSFRPGLATGYSVYAGGDSNSVTTNNQFHYAFLNAGVFCNSVQAVLGWYFSAILDSADVNSNRSAQFYGPGANAVWAFGAATNSYYGVAQNNGVNNASNKASVGTQYLSASGQPVTYTPGQATVPFHTETGQRFAVVGADGEAVFQSLYAFGNRAFLNFWRYDGTLASPTAPLNGEDLGGFGFGGYNGSGLAGAAQIKAVAAGNWSTSNSGAGLFFLTVLGSSNTQQLSAVLAASGGFFVGTGFADPGTGNIQASNSVGTGVTVVGSLGTPTAGKRWMVSDSNVVAAGNFGAIVATGGGNTVSVYADGTNWRIG